MIDETPSKSGLSQADHVIGKLGGVNATARLLGHKNASTVQGWRARGFIPGPRQQELLNAARASGVSLSEHDFIVHLTAGSPACASSGEAAA